MPRHTVVVSSYNRPAFVAKAIASVRAQSVGDWEALVADDGSGPETLAAIRGASEGEPRIRLLECQEPRKEGPASAVPNRCVRRINEALAASGGDVVHYLADDDWFHPDRLAAFDLLFSNASAMVGYGRLVYVTRDGGTFGAERFPPGPTRNVRWKLDHNQVAHRRSALEKVRGWPEPPPGDYCFDAYFFEALARHWEFRPVDRVVAFKRLHSLNLTTTKGMTTDRRE